MLFGLLQRYKYKLVFNIKLIKLSTFLLTDFSGDSPVVQDSELGWQHLAKLYPHRAAQNRPSVSCKTNLELHLCSTSAQVGA